MYTYLMNWGEQATSFDGLWLIEGAPETVVVDTGRASIVSGFSQSMAATLGFETVQSLDDGLAKFGLEPADVDLVIITHLHFDHVELARKYPRARFLVQKAELDFAFNPRGVSAAQSYRRELFEGLKFEVVEGDSKVLPGIEVLLTPGHSAGGQSVAISTGAGLAVITGFCCIAENLDPPEEIRDLMPVITPGMHINTPELDESMLRIKDIADIIVPLHDPEFFLRDRIPGA